MRCSSADALSAPSDPSLALHRRQLAEVDDLAERGLLAEPEADTLRAEAARYHAEAAEIETGVKTRELKEPPEQK